jgi:hypothetical protein
MFTPRFFFMVVVSVTASPVTAQVISKQTIDAFQRRNNTGAELLTTGPKRAKLWTSTLPVSFARLEKADGEWRVGASMALGGSYVFVTGKATPQADGSMRLDPEFMIGPVANIGIAPGDTGGIDGTLLVGATMGFSSFAILGGYDVLLGRPVIGVGMQIQSLTFTEALTNLKSIK